MCGIVGMIGARSATLRAELKSMTDRLVHRGPDDGGCWADDDAALGHRRLSILDLSASGHQPMLSRDQRYVLVYNGEIYNHLDLRRELEAAGHAPDWHGHSDTETLLAAVVAWGLNATLRKTMGMFALALWDRHERQLLLARDRFGEKPLYWTQAAGGLMFASELKALEQNAAFAPAIDPQMLRYFLGRGHLPANRAIFAGCGQIAPGTISRFDHRGELREAFRYYDYVDVVAEGARHPFTDAAQVQVALRNALSAAIERQLISDVDLGLFLSGGIDSSLVVALAGRIAGRGLRTFSIGFETPGYDEAPFARAVAQHVGGDHHELYVQASDALDLVERLPYIWDEPFGDASQIPTLLVSRFARQHVTVALTGDGGDEMFGGYNRHAAIPRLSAMVGRLPAAAARPFLAGLSAIPASWWNAAVALRGGTRADFVGHKIRRIASIALESADPAALYNRMLDGWYGRGDPVRGVNDVPVSEVPTAPCLDLAGRIMLADALSYLPGDILTKVDRAGMAVSLEARMPFLDPGVAAVASRIPAELRFRGGRGKAPLRQLLAELLPAHLTERPKAGFSVPLGAWLRGPLREWADALLSRAALDRAGLLNHAVISPLWNEHLESRADHGDLLWNVLMYQAWSVSRAFPA